MFELNDELLLVDHFVDRKYGFFRATNKVAILRYIKDVVQLVQRPIDILIGVLQLKVWYAVEVELIVRPHMD